MSSSDYRPVEPLNPALKAYTRHVESGRLVPVGTRTALGTYLRDTWERRTYIWREAQTKARTKNSQNRWGMWWSILKPTADAAFFWLLFAVILNTSRGVANYTAFIIIGVLMFQYFASSMTSNAVVMRQNRGMIKSFSFPRISIPLALALRNALSHVPVMGVILVGVMVLPPHELPAFSWLLLPPLFALCFIFNLGLGLLIARFAYVFPDLQQIIGFATRFLMYASGVMFPIDMFISHPVIYQLVVANPIYQFLTLFRSLIIDGSAGDPMLWLWVSLWSFGALLLGFIVFWRAEESYGSERN